VASFRDWYTKGHLHFLKDGMSYWWNDEGETQWFTYYYWNLAQQQQWKAVRPNERLFTINRAFQPGMQRFPAVTWSGDGQVRRPSQCRQADSADSVLGPRIT
jgi:alpha-glucosidase